jgi:hypothetical protein
MDGHTGLTPLLIDAKETYLRQVTNVMAPYVLSTFKEMYDDASKQKRHVMQTFQHSLRQIPGWNSHTVRSVTDKIEVRHKSLNKLIAALFVSVVKILSSIRLHKDRQPEIRLKLPSNDAFVHQVYIHAAEKFYNAPYLINESKTVRIDKVRAGVEAAVDAMLPIDDILTAYLGGSVDDDNTVSPLPDEQWHAAAHHAHHSLSDPPAAPPPPSVTMPSLAPSPPSVHGVADDEDAAGDRDTTAGDQEEVAGDAGQTKDIDVHAHVHSHEDVVVPSTQTDPERKREKELFSDAEDDL